MHPPTGKSFELEFCTVAAGKNGEVVEEKLFYDQVGSLRQIGLLQRARSLVAAAARLASPRVP